VRARAPPDRASDAVVDAPRPVSPRSWVRTRPFPRRVLHAFTLLNATKSSFWGAPPGPALHQPWLAAQRASLVRWASRPARLQLSRRADLELVLLTRRRGEAWGRGELSTATAADWHSSTHTAAIAANCTGTSINTNKALKFEA
jgi:hypothetical protein